MWLVITRWNPVIPVILLVKNVDEWFISNWSSVFYYPLEYRKDFKEIATNAEDAVEAGAEIVICSLILENNDEKIETMNVGIFPVVVRQKKTRNTTYWVVLCCRA